MRSQNARSRGTERHGPGLDKAGPWVVPSLPGRIGELPVGLLLLLLGRAGVAATTAGLSLELGLGLLPRA